MLNIFKFFLEKLILKIKNYFRESYVNSFGIQIVFINQKPLFQMKKVVLLVFLAVSVLSFGVSAQSSTDTSKSAMPTPATTIPSLDVLVAQNYLGKYKVKDAPIEELVITLQDGKLMGEAVGQGSAELAPTAEIDIFSVIGYDGKIEFVRNDNKSVIKIKLTLQGNTMEGEKQL